MNNLSQTRLDPDDPRLTAYALGELEGLDAAQVAAAVAADPSLQTVVEEIRATAGRLTTALKAEPLPKPARPVHLEPYHTVRPARIFPFPYWAVAGMAAAACVALILALREVPLAQDAATRRLERTVERPSATVTPTVTAATNVVQPPNHIDLVPTETTETPSEQNDQVLAVVPNPPPAAATIPAAPAQVTVTEVPAPLPPPTDQERGVKMQALEVKADESAAGKQATSTLAGTRLSVPREVPAPAATGVPVPVSISASSHPSAGKAQEEVIQLSPFMVNVGEQKKYMAENTLAGTRVRGLKDVGSSISVVTTQVLTDTRVTVSSQARPGQAFNTEAYDYVADNDFLGAAQNPLSTFSVDVDTASYSNVRRFLLGNQRPPRDAVRIEELVNYFTYDYAAPKPADKDPFAASLEVAAAPWEPTHRLVRIGLKGRELASADRPAANLVFLVDVSGSMGEPNKLPLVQESLRMLIEQLKSEDHVAIVTYAGTSGLALPSTSLSHRQEILDAIDSLRAGGSTNGAMGIQLAYDIARANFIAGGVNRVILSTDGDFNIGVTDRGDLVRLIEGKAKSGVFLTALGFGMGNYKDATLEQLADKGHGAYAYIDSSREARKVLAEQVSGTLAVIAKDVKVQVEFNPARVQAYRLIGYENRLLKKEDFNNDKLDAGDIGAGHTVTALYEVIPAGVDWKPESTVDELKYQKPAAENRIAKRGDRIEDHADSPVSGFGKPVSQELLTVKIRYKTPDGATSKLLEFPLTDPGAAFASASGDFKFAAAVAGFGMVLRDSPHKGATTLDAVLRWAAQGLSSDAGGYRGEFISLVKRAETILPSQG
jgi:secreted protein with Ig-like and vWFA domain